MAREAGIPTIGAEAGDAVVGVSGEAGRLVGTGAAVVSVGERGEIEGDATGGGDARGEVADGGREVDAGEGGHFSGAAREGGRG